MDTIPVSSTTYTFNPDGLQQQHLEIVDANSLPHEVSGGYLDGLGSANGATDTVDAAAADAANTLLYADSSATAGVPSDIDTAADHGAAHEYIQPNPNHGGILYANQDNDALTQPTNPVAQSEMDLEPIDLEEVQKIQARMPVADPNAPVGSNTNPIRIIQQGNQYITTQDVSDEHLQQIIQVLTNQALLSNSTSRPNAIYNRLTNRRIIFRVTRAKRRPDDVSTTSVGGSEVGDQNDYDFQSSKPVGPRSKGRNPPVRQNVNGDKQKRRRHESDDEDPDFENPEEGVLPFPLSRQSAVNTGRVSKTPKHLTKDYKHLDDMTNNKPVSSNEDPSDGGFSDYVNEGVSDDDTLLHCSVCNRSYMTRSGLVKHEKRCIGQEMQRTKTRFVNPYVANMKRRTKLKEAITESTEEDIIQLAAPRVSKLMSSWDHLLIRSEEGKPPLPHVGRMLRDYLNLSTRIRSFLAEHLEPCAEPAKRRKTHGRDDLDDDFEDLQEEDKHNVYIQIKSAEHSELLGLSCGRYMVKNELNEEYLPRRFRSAISTLKSKSSQGLDDSSGLVSVDTADDDNVQATLRSDADSQNQGIINLGDELLLLPEGGLGGPVPEEWITSGAFLAVLTETGETSDLAMESSTGRLFHRPTGHLVSLPDTDATVDTTGDASQDGDVADQPSGQIRPVAELPDYGAYEDEIHEPMDEPAVEEPLNEPTAVSQSPAKKSRPKVKPRPKSKQQKPQQSISEESEPLSKDFDDQEARREELLRKIAESGDVIDLNTLFPGVSVTEVSPGVCVVTKPNGDKFNVEHGGEGITLDTLQTILEMGT